MYVEDCILNQEIINIPITLIDNEALLRLMFSHYSWDLMSEQHKSYLMIFLPDFVKESVDEKSKTLDMLLSGENFRFKKNPLLDFQHKLHTGLFKVDIVHMKNYLFKSLFKEYWRRQRMYYYEVFKLSLVRRMRYLRSTLEFNTSLVPPVMEAITEIKSEVNDSENEKQ